MCNGDEPKTCLWKTVQKMAGNSVKVRLDLSVKMLSVLHTEEKVTAAVNSFVQSCLYELENTQRLENLNKNITVIYNTW